MFAKGMRADTEFGDESDTAQGITPTHHQFATSTARAATAQNWFSPALNHAEASAKAAAFYLSAIRIPQYPVLPNFSFLIFFPPHSAFRIPHSAISLSSSFILLNF